MKQQFVCFQKGRLETAELVSVELGQRAAAEVYAEVKAENITDLEALEVSVLKVDKCAHFAVTIDRSPKAAARQTDERGVLYPEAEELTPSQHEPECIYAEDGSDRPHWPRCPCLGLAPHGQGG